MLQSFVAVLGLTVSPLGEFTAGAMIPAVIRRARPLSMATVFIDGEAGTTGLQVRDRLSARSDVEVISLPEADRKDAAARTEAINTADAVILCLPDAAAIEAASLVATDNDKTVLIDASTAHRTDPAWDYGFPEISAEQRARIAQSKRISNPGCYATGFIAVTHPLVDAGLLRPSAALVASAISGYSGGGKALMGVFEGSEPHEPWGAYGFSLNHKHLPEMAKYSGLSSPPIFLPAVGSFAQGMVVSVPIHYERDLEDGIEGDAGAAIHAALSKHYADSRFVSVMPLGESTWKEEGLLERGAFLRPDALNGTNQLQVFVYCNEEARTCVVAARLDNLGKGASGAAVQNLNIALGLDEGTGLL
uniref:Semialdehyde dehydrogenase NAD-binding domain-containing protein n=1 Tax=Haptolina brevifila TaxID=156173 RepID=A0A7S2G3X4_9EUKA|mmetsp:Transcript_26223/g.52563  ORF Transcript_26223/g.52563 Transcript_26223/m.52563 type:complete len:362 (+) Transcript_26223:67-1152(+)